jgi:hypothetical protein
MEKQGKSKVELAAACLLCIAVTWRYRIDLGGTEFSGGWLTGPLLNMEIVGSLLFVLALLLTFLYERVAAAISVIACLLCLPLFLYFTAPGPVRWVFRTPEWSVPLRTSFVWDTWTVGGIIVLSVTACVGVRGLFFAADSQTRNSAQVYTDSSHNA